jgi:hypothetical protein
VLDRRRARDVLLPILLQKLTDRQGLRDWHGRDGERRQRPRFSRSRFVRRVDAESASVSRMPTTDHSASIAASRPRPDHDRRCRVLRDAFAAPNW